MSQEAEPKELRFPGKAVRKQTEIFYGIQILPEGQRQQKLLDGASIVFEYYLPERILAFDRQAAEL